MTVTVFCDLRQVQCMQCTNPKKLEMSLMYLKHNELKTKQDKRKIGGYM